MRQSVGTTWLLQLMILFILLFVGFIVLTINYNKVVKQKNEILTMIEKNEGLNDKSISLVNNYLTRNGYTTKSKCVSEDDEYQVYGAVSLDSDFYNVSDILVEAEPGVDYYYCIKKFEAHNKSNYYQVTLFYSFNLPVIGDASRFNIKGTTSSFQAKDASYYN